MPFTDKALTCKDCGNTFVFTAGEQQFFHDKQFTNLPKRCKECKRRHAKSLGAKPARAVSETVVICADCGEETTVPFIPRANRPVLCRACYAGHKVQHA